MVYLSNNVGRPKRVKEIAKRLRASEAHLAKVLQNLARAGLLKAVRGPKGGYELARPPEEITLLEIFEVVHGPLEDQRCLFKEPLCSGERCILGDLLQKVNQAVKDHFSQTNLDMVRDILT
ncbi:MAG: Rrf2 family transcriptional regulator [Thermodesulfobacteria bacterium]|nr:Rrf2 family transcriptional regulator [Thermodesulfobacteriota bacterium]